MVAKLNQSLVNKLKIVHNRRKFSEVEVELENLTSRQKEVQNWLEEETEQNMKSVNYTFEK